MRCALEPMWRHEFIFCYRYSCCYCCYYEAAEAVDREIASLLRERVLCCSSFLLFFLPSLLLAHPSLPPRTASKMTLASRGKLPNYKYDYKYD